MADLLKSLFDISPALKSNEVIIERLNSTQDQIIKKGMIDLESQVN